MHAQTYLALTHGQLAVGHSDTISARLRTVSTLSTHKTFVHPQGKVAATRYLVREAFALHFSDGENQCCCVPMCGYIDTIHT